MNNNKIKFFVEGFADRLLLEILEIHPKYIEKKGAVSKLERSMKKQLNDFHKIIIGIIDYDKGKSLHFFEDFNLCDKPDNIILKHKYNSNQYIIFLKPKAIEKWLLDAAESVNIKPENFNIPSDLKQFIKITKHINISQNTDFINFIREIKKKKADPLMFLQKILYTLTKEKTYPCKTN